MTDKPQTRLFVEDYLAAGQSLELSEDHTHFLKNVLRLKEGAVVAFFNGRNGEWHGRIASFGRRNATALIEVRSRTQETETDLWLVFAPIKRARIDFLVEKATELGASALLPVMTRRTNVERMNLDRLQAHAVEAAEQSERLTVPVVHAPQSLDGLMSSWDSQRKLVVCDETGTAPPIAAALASEAPGEWAVLIGPEGGFTEDELDGLRKLPFVRPVSLGPRVLRADTAAIAALAVLQAVLGEAPRHRS
jgi:16S rRNA (uracil1498-N3)-methyltransferase